MTDTKEQAATRKRVRKRIDNEVSKVNTVMQAGVAFSEVNTYEEFLDEAKKIFEAYGFEFKKENFKLLKRPESDGNNTKVRRLPGK